MMYLFLVVAAWVLGFASYLLFTGLIFHQTISFGDAIAVAFWTGIVFGFFSFFINLPIFIILRRKYGGCNDLRPFILVPLLTTVIPVFVLIFCFGGGVFHIISSESILFIALFSVSNIFLGLGFVYISNWNIN